MFDMHAFLEAFIPLFVAIDGIGLIPIFIGVTASKSRARRRELAMISVGVAALLCVGFMFLGHLLFRFLGIGEPDFRIAGGVLLLTFAVTDLLTTGKPAVHEDEMAGIFPLATPLVAGPATLTTTLVLAHRDGIGYAYTSLALAANFMILALMLLASDLIVRLVGMNTLKAMSKLVMILLAAIAVSYIRVGVTEIFMSLKH